MLYMKSDVILLGDVFDKLSKISYEKQKINILYCYTPIGRILTSAQSTAYRIFDSTWLQFCWANAAVLVRKRSIKHYEFYSIHKSLIALLSIDFCSLAVQQQLDF